MAVVKDGWRELTQICAQIGTDHRDQEVWSLQPFEARQRGGHGFLHHLLRREARVIFSPIGQIRRKDDSSSKGAHDLKRTPVLFQTLGQHSCLHGVLTQCIPWLGRLPFHILPGGSHSYWWHIASTRSSPRLSLGCSKFSIESSARERRRLSGRSGL